MKRFLRKSHKWLGLIIGIIILFFSITGIILNHRKAIAGIDICRESLPKSYHIENYNNGIIRGTKALDNHHLIIWGNAGIWSTDSSFSKFRPMMNGIPEGADNRNIIAVVQDSKGQLWTASPWALYLWKKGWKKQFERPIQDITIKGDTLVVVTNQAILTSVAPFKHFTPHYIKGKTHKKNIFHTIMSLHSGELFGLPGILFVDGIAITLLILTITGAIFTFYKKKAKIAMKCHNILGYWLIVFTIGITVTGICLRDPLSGILKKITYDSHVNHIDGLKAIRWNSHAKRWMLITQKEMFWLNHLDGTVTKMGRNLKLTNMGIHVFEPIDSTRWIIGSLRGSYIFNPESDKVKKIGKNIAVMGFSKDLCENRLVIFDKRKGALDLEGKRVSKGIKKTPRILKEQGMPLWNIALEIHVGRFFINWIKCMSSSVYVNISGILILIVLITGLVILPKKTKKYRSK